MLIRVVVLFLLAMAVIGLVGGLFRKRLPPPPRDARARLPPAPVICARCRNPVVGSGPCPCEGRKG
jgi:hypothetical protein